MPGNEHSFMPAEEVVLVDSYFRAIHYMYYFPFFGCEVKCGNTGLEIADRQNAHSMTLAV